MNVRLSYADCNNDGEIQPASEILEENNYYPFGLRHQGYNEIANANRSEQAEKYKYNGKKFEDSFGLNIYEMDLRQYDPAIGRWTVQDPVVHHEFSPYSAFDNNPAYWADPSGANSIQYDWGTGMYNVLGNNGDVLKIIESGSFNLSEYLNNPDKYINHILYSMDANFDESGNDDGGGKGNGGGNGNGNGNNESNNKLIDEKIQQYLKLMKATDLALNLNQYNSYYSKKFISNALYKRAIPIIEIGGNYYRLYYSQELNNNYSKGEFIYDTTGTLTGFTVGATIGGLPGAVVGVLVGASFEGAKEAYRVVKPGFMSGFNNFIDSAVGNWMKYN